jgi:hypothetical protein
MAFYEIANYLELGCNLGIFVDNESAWQLLLKNFSLENIPNILLPMDKLGFKPVKILGAQAKWRKSKM